MGMHRSRVCYFVIDVSDLGQGVAFWTAALGGAEEKTPEAVRSTAVSAFLTQKSEFYSRKLVTTRHRKSACISIWKRTM
jgi:hypothetical protein